MNIKYNLAYTCKDNQMQTLSFYNWFGNDVNFRSFSPTYSIQVLFTFLEIYLQSFLCFRNIALLRSLKMHRCFSKDAINFNLVQLINILLILPINDWGMSIYSYQYIFSNVFQKAPTLITMYYRLLKYYLRDPKRILMLISNSLIWLSG